MKQKSLQITAPLLKLSVGDDDWAAVPRLELLWMYQQMALIRAFETKLLALKDANLVNGPVHSSVGQEAVAVGAALAVRREDKFCGTHRAHHQYLAKAFSACAPGDYDPLRHGFTDAMQAHVLTLMKEIMGLADGCSGGRGGVGARAPAAWRWRPYQRAAQGGQDDMLCSRHRERMLGQAERNEHEGFANAGSQSQ